MIDRTHVCNAEDIESNRDKPVALLCVAHLIAGVVAGLAAIALLAVFAPS
jgi:hypothetical protein